MSNEKFTKPPAAVQKAAGKEKLFQKELSKNERLLKEEKELATTEKEEKGLKGLANNTREDNEEKSSIKVSICNDTGPYGLANGIMRILEGFGLLNFKAETSEMPKELEQAVTNVLEGQPSLEENTAGMQVDLSAQAAGNLTAEYAGSLAEAKGQGENTIPAKGERAGNIRDSKPEIRSGQEDPATRIRFKRIHTILKRYSESKETGTEGRGFDDLVMKEDLQRNDNTVFGLKNGLQTEQTPKMAVAETVLKTVESAHMADNVSRIVEELSARTTDGIHEFDITLKPEFLGKLSIKLIMDNEGMKAKLKTGDAAVKGLLMDQMPQLREMLESKGIHVVQAEVAYENPAFENSGQSGRQHYEAGKNNSKQRKTAEEISWNSLSCDAIAQIDLMAKNSSVEFRA
ncbi:MAG: flagellar hook-length control protein FliK [Christensenellales bacterium]